MIISNNLKVAIHDTATEGLVQQLVSNSRELGLNENGFILGKIVIIRKFVFT